MTGYVYSLSYDGAVFYVGSSFNLKSRLASHRTRFGYNTKMDVIEELEVSHRVDLEKEEMYEA